MLTRSAARAAAAAISSDDDIVELTVPATPAVAAPAPLPDSGDDIVELSGPTAPLAPAAGPGLGGFYPDFALPPAMSGSCVIAWFLASRFPLCPSASVISSFSFSSPPTLTLDVGFLLLLICWSSPCPPGPRAVVWPEPPCALSPQARSHAPAARQLPAGVGRSRRYRAPRAQLTARGRAELAFLAESPRHSLRPAGLEGGECPSLLDLPLGLSPLSPARLGSSPGSSP